MVLRAVVACGVLFLVLLLVVDHAACKALDVSDRRRLLLDRPKRQVGGGGGLPAYGSVSRGAGGDGSVGLYPPPPEPEPEPGAV